LLLLFSTLGLFACSVPQHPRDADIQWEAATFPPGNAVIFGDSLTAQTYLPTWCGKHLLNAAISGSGIPGDYVFVDTVLTRANPEAVILAWGINDARSEEVADWLKRFEALVRHIQRPTVIVGIWPVSDRRFRSDFIHAANLGLAAIAKRTGSKFVAAPATAETRDGLSRAPGVYRLERFLISSHQSSGRELARAF
jgi:hypothetical protein